MQHWSVVQIPSKYLQTGADKRQQGLLFCLYPSGRFSANPEILMSEKSKVGHSAGVLHVKGVAAFSNYQRAYLSSWF